MIFVPSIRLFYTLSHCSVLFSNPGNPGFLPPLISSPYREISAWSIQKTNRGRFSSSWSFCLQEQSYAGLLALRDSGEGGQELAFHPLPLFLLPLLGALGVGWGGLDPLTRETSSASWQVCLPSADVSTMNSVNQWLLHSRQ